MMMVFHWSRLRSGRPGIKTKHTSCLILRLSTSSSSTPSYALDYIYTGVYILAISRIACQFMYESSVLLWKIFVPEIAHPCTRLCGQCPRTLAPLRYIHSTIPSITAMPWSGHVELIVSPHLIGFRKSIWCPFHFLDLSLSM